MSRKAHLKNYINHLLYLAGFADVHDMNLENSFGKIIAKSKNPLSRIDLSTSYFSQVDEDAILEAILERIGRSSQSKPGTFVELGVGNGTENNTLLLAARGWQGFWFGGQEISFNTHNAFRNKLEFYKCWITQETLKEIIIPKILKINNLDVLSLDLDGNDWHFCRSLLESGVQPKVWIQEYNATFPPDVDWCMVYDEKHKWDLTSYFGASLLAFVKLFDRFGYRLVACNVTGANAFFIKNEFSTNFSDVPESVSDLYMPSRPWLYRARKKIDGRAMSGFNFKIDEF